MSVEMRPRIAASLIAALAACSTKSNPPDNGARVEDAASGISPPADSSLAPTDGAATLTDVDLSTIMALYKSWQPQAATPENISGYIFGLCRAPTLHETAFSTSEHGNDRYLLDWANVLAVEGLKRKGAPAFAVGSAIVKEKLLRGGDGGFGVVALGIMSKRESGFDPANGDWEYGYWEEAPGLLRSPAQSAHCGGCHAGAKDSDFVFVDKTWLSK